MADDPQHDGGGPEVEPSIEDQNKALAEQEQQAEAALKMHILRVAHETKQFIATRVQNDTVYLNVAIEVAVQTVNQIAALHPAEVASLRPAIQLLLLHTADPTAQQ